MTLPRLLFAALLLSATAAEARQDPNPPPSGIVIHLFGPHSAFGSGAPSLPGLKPSAPAAPLAPAAAASGSPAAVSAQMAQAPAPAPAPTEAEPTTHDILHQMFVTGTGKPTPASTGRNAEQPYNQ